MCTRQRLAALEHQPHHAPVLPDELEHLDVLRQPVLEQRRSARRAALLLHDAAVVVDARRQAREQRLDDLAERLFLVREVQVEGALRLAGARGDVLHLRAVEPDLDEHRLGGAQEVHLGVRIRRPP
jgi:hypothetical protein